MFAPQSCRSMIQHWGRSALVLVPGLTLGVLGFGVTPLDAKALGSEPRITPQPLSSPAFSQTPHPVAQLFYPPAGPHQGVMVVGRGRASLPADSATIEFYLYKDGYDESFEDEFRSTGVVSSLRSVNYEELGDGEGIAEADLDPLVEALTALGIAGTAITTELSDTDSYSATVRVEIAKPTQAQIKDLVTAGETSMDDDSSILVQDVSVVYSLEDCQELETAAYRSAVTDGTKRATAIAAELQVSLNHPPSIAESLFNLVVPGCNSEGPNFSSLFSGFGGYAPYNPDKAAEVELQRDIFMTYPVR